MKTTKILLAVTAFFLFAFNTNAKAQTLNDEELEKLKDFLTQKNNYQKLNINAINDLDNYSANQWTDIGVSWTSVSQTEKKMVVLNGKTNLLQKL
jgi:hypothetical protein